MKLISVAGVIVVLLALVPVFGSAAESVDFDIPNGHFYKQANGQGGAGDTGYPVTDDEGILFWTWFQSLGGVDNVGYPVTQRFVWNNFAVQAFQKVVLQWRPDTRVVAIVNVFDEISAAGKDDWLLSTRSTPKSFDWSSDTGKSGEQIALNHYAILDQSPPIKAVYFSASDPVTMNGYPMATADFDSVFVVRAQRKVFQLWKQDTPWAKAGTVTVANGGDIGKEVGLYPAAATIARPFTPTLNATPQAGSETVVDDAGPGFSTVGLWYLGDGGKNYGAGCHWAPRGPANVATWQPALPASGAYEVFAWCCGDPDSNQSSGASFTVSPAGGQSYRAQVNLQEKAGQWNSLGTYIFASGSTGSVSISGGFDYNVVADAVKFVYRGPNQQITLPTPVPTPTMIVTNHPPSPLEQLTKGDLTRRLNINQSTLGYPVTPFEATPDPSELLTFDDCQAFPGEGCGGQRTGWRARVHYDGFGVTYRVSADYRYVVAEPSGDLSGRQRVFCTGQSGDLFFSVDRLPDGTWYLFSNKQQAVNLSLAAPADVAKLLDLSGRYSSIRTGSGGTTSITMYGLGPLARTTSVDQNELQSLGDRLLAQLK